MMMPMLMIMGRKPTRLRLNSPPPLWRPQVLPGERRARRLRAVRRHRPAGRRQPLEEGVFPGGGRPREAPHAAVALEAQGGLLPPLRDPAESQRGGAERAGAGHHHGRSVVAESRQAVMTSSHVSDSFEGH